MLSLQQILEKGVPVMRAFIIAIVAALALTMGPAVTAYADSVEKPMTVIRMQNDGKTAAQICRYLRARGIMPGTVRECIAETLLQNDLANSAATRPLETVRVLVYDGEVARSLAVAEPAAEAASTSPPQQAAGVPEPEDKTPWLWLILAVLVALGIAYKILSGTFKKLPEDDGSGKPVPASEPPAQVEDEVQDDTSEGEAEAQADEAAPVQEPSAQVEEEAQAETVNDGDNDAEAQAEAVDDVQQVSTDEPVAEATPPQDEPTAPPTPEDPAPPEAPPPEDERR